MKKRIVSAAILLPLIIAIFIIGNWPYRLLVLAVTLVAGLEYVQMLRRREFQLSLLSVMGMTIAWEVGAFRPDGVLEDTWLVPAVTLATLAIVFWELVEVRRGQRPNPTEQWALTLAGGTYLGLGGLHLIGLRDLPDGLWWTLTTCIVVWVGDSAAYMVGSRWGHRKMAPTISPGKSWEGYAAQVVSGLATGYLVVWLWAVISGDVLTLTPVYGLIVGGVVSALCPVGDFFVSMIKREVGVKDTSNLVPGHGGVFDRIDSILWAAMLGHLLAQWMI